MWAETGRPLTKYVCHILLGTLLFVVICCAAFGLDYVVRWMRDHDFDLWELKCVQRAKTVIFLIDVGWYFFFLIRNIYKECKECTVRWRSMITVPLFIFVCSPPTIYWYLSQQSSAIQPSPMYVAKSFRITTPMPGGKAKFTMEVGQGGRVKVKGESPQLKPSEVILLTVTPENQYEIPQTAAKADEMSPDARGDWSTTVQVGNATYAPVAGQTFTIKMYVVPKYYYDQLRDDAKNGHPCWPLPNKSKPTVIVECTFTLTE